MSKRHWNYRIIDSIDTYPNKSSLDIEEMKHLYSIHEVYYEDDKPTSWTQKAIKLKDFYDLEDLEFTIDKIKESFWKPILKLVLDQDGQESLKEEK